MVLAFNFPGGPRVPPQLVSLGPHLPRHGGPRNAAQGAAGPAPAPPGPGVPGCQGVPGAAGHGLAGPRIVGGTDMRGVEY